MTYAKLENDLLKDAPKKVIYNDSVIINPSEDKLLELGYLPVIFTDMPTDVIKKHHYESHWEEKDGKIVQSWGLVKDIPCEEPQEVQEQKAAIAYSKMMMKREVLNLSVDEKLELKALFDEWEKGIFKIDDIRRHNNQLWRCCQLHDSTIDTNIEPGKSPAHWVQYHGQSKAFAQPFVHPTGAHDIYKKSDYMIYTDDEVYLCKEDTSFSPDEYPKAWEIIK